MRASLSEAGEEDEGEEGAGDAPTVRRLRVALYDLLRELGPSTLRDLEYTYQREYLVKVSFLFEKSCYVIVNSLALSCLSAPQ